LGSVMWSLSSPSLKQLPTRLREYAKAAAK
jgi:hypothetical protein